VLSKGKTITKSGITYIVTSSSKTSPEVEVFDYTTQKKTVTIPDTITYKNVKYKVVGIGVYAFWYNTKLNKITIGKNIKYINTGAFDDCKKLKSVVIKSTKIKKVGSNAFYNTSKSLKVKVPKASYSKYKKLFKNKGNKKLKVKK